MLAAACDHHGVLDTGAACLPADADIVVYRSLLATLHAYLLATLSALLGILGGDIRRQFSDATWGQVSLSHRIADGMLSGDATSLLGGVLESASRFLETL
jgi:hypothetical protein